MKRIRLGVYPTGVTGGRSKETGIKKTMRYLTGFLRIFLIVFGILFIGVVLCFGNWLPENRIPQSKVNDEYLDVYDSRIRYRVYKKGTNQDLWYLLLHGFGENLEDWEPLVQNMPEGNFVLIDIVGFGLSDKPDIVYSLDNISTYIVEFIELMQMDNIIFIGSSMGASLSAWTSSKITDKTSGLILFAPSAYPKSMRHRWPGNLFYRPGFLNRAGAVLARSLVIKRLFPNSLGVQALNVTSSYDESFVQVLSSIEQPTLLFWSKGDKRVPFSYSDNYLENIRNSKLIEKPEAAGHAIATFAPEETALEIIAFVKENISN